MSEQQDQSMVHKLILVREFGRQGYRWNRAFRKELWRRLERRAPLRETGREERSGNSH